MMGNPQRVNMILGYDGVGPGDWIASQGTYRDNLIAKKFVSYMSSGKTIKDAWFQANRDYGINYSSVLYNSNSKNDKITSMSTNTVYTNPYPSISLEVNGGLKLYSSPNATISMSSNSQVETNVGKNTEEFISKGIEEATIEQNEDLMKPIFDFNNNIENTINELNQYLSDEKLLPGDAVLYSIMIRKEIPIYNLGEEVLDANPRHEYIIQYKQMIENMNISSLNNGSFMEVYVQNRKISKIEKRWNKIEKLFKLNDKKQKNIKYKEKKELKTATDKHLKQYYNEDLNLRDEKLVYFINNKGEIALGWEMDYNDITLFIDASTGEIQ